ncbi:MAG: DUF6247 family protein [Actinomycetia bacterium]|nr:DUF6247 family protein [Actinomycetes bacterium]
MSATYSVDESSPGGRHSLAKGASPEAIRSALLVADQSAFDLAYDKALSEARESLDLTRLYGSAELGPATPSPATLRVGPVQRRLDGGPRVRASSSSGSRRPRCTRPWRGAAWTGYRQSPVGPAPWVAGAVPATARAPAAALSARVCQGPHATVPRPTRGTVAVSVGCGSSEVRLSAAGWQG